MKGRTARQSNDCKISGGLVGKGWSVWFGGFAWLWFWLVGYGFLALACTISRKPNVVDTTQNGYGAARDLVYVGKKNKKENT